jgi:putative thioredoxin
MRPSFSMSGVVDLSALKQPAPRPATPGAVPAPAAASGDGAPYPVVIDVSEADFQTEVLERSTQVPVVLDLWADWCGPCKQLSPVLEKIAQEYGGRFILAKVDTDANPRLAQALRVQGIPAVKAIVGGELIGEFTGAQPEAQVRQWITDLLALADREFGLTGPVAGGALPGPAEPPLDPAMAAAYDALAVDDLDGAAQALRNVLSSSPNHPEAKPALAQVELLRRTQGIDPAAVVAHAKQNPQDLDARCAAADAVLSTGDVDGALTAMLDVIRDFTGEDRDRGRRLLLDYFELLGPDDPRVAKARGRLTSLLF